MKKPIRTMVEEKLKQKGWGVSDENVREIIRKLLNRICELLPNDKSQISEEFASIMFNNIGQNKVVEILVGKAIDERDDLLGYKCLRQKIEKAINMWR